MGRRLPEAALAEATLAASPLPEPAAPGAPGAVDSPAITLFAKVLAARSLNAAAHALTAALAADFGFQRTSIGLHEDGRTRLLACSDQDPADPQADLPQHLIGAMDEAIEQARTLGWPVAPGDDADLVRVEQRALQRLVGGAVASLPLGCAGEILGAVCVQATGPLDAAVLQRLEQALSLAAPALRWMQRGGEPWHRRAGRDALAAWARLRRPDRRTARRLAGVATLALLFAALAPLPHGVSGRARVEGAEQRVLVAPADGYIKASHVRPGDRVREGDVLVDLLDADLRLERDRWASQRAQHENAYAAAVAKSDRTAASTSLSRMGEAQAELALVEGQLERGRVAAPFDGLVIQGDLSQTIGAPVRRGDTLMTLATTGRHRIIVDVDEVDIARVQPGQAGHLGLSSLPWGREDIVVERITPLAKAVEGRNVFEVEARLVAPLTGLRPGLLGRAEITVGHRPPLWAWTGRALERLRVAWWAFLG